MRRASSLATDVPRSLTVLLQESSVVAVACILFGRSIYVASEDALLNRQTSRGTRCALRPPARRSLGLSLFLCVAEKAHASICSSPKTSWSAGTAAMVLCGVYMLSVCLSCANQFSCRLAATLGAKSSFKKLPKRSVLDANISQLCGLVAEPPEPLALRLSSNLMIGVTRLVGRLYAIQRDL